MTAAPTKHWRLGPSSSTRWLPCNGSALAEMPVVENMYGGREEGTDEHGIAAEILLGRATLDDTQSAGVVAYVQHVWSNEYDHILVERSFESIEVPDHGGTLDCLLIKDNTAVIYDYKSGKWPVKAEHNSQLLCYAGIIQEHFDIDEFFGVIVQPNSKAKNKITVARYPDSEVTDHRDRVKAAAVSDERCVGQHCLFCPLLQAKVCEVGRKYATGRQWIGKYKHLPA